MPSITALHLLAAADPAALPPLWRWAPKWGYFLGLALAIGLPALHVLAVRPALAARPTVTAAEAPNPAARARMHRLIGMGSIAFGVLVLLQLVATTARATEVSFGAALSPVTLWNHLTEPAEDGAWFGGGVPAGAQLVLVAVAVLLLGPLARRADIGSGASGIRRAAGAERRVTLGLVAATAATLVTAMPASPDDLTAEAIAGSVLEQAHIVGSSLWVGGLIGLVALTRTRPDAFAGDLEAWSTLWARFSIVAMASVAALTVSGAWLAWMHVGTFAQLLTTTYGLLLLTKVALVAGLVAFGAFNQLHLMPRIARLRRAGHTAPALVLAVRHFGRVVAMEAALGTTVLLIVGLLSGSARKQAGGDAAEVGLQVLGWGGLLVVGIAIAYAVTAGLASAIARRPLAGTTDTTRA